MGASTVASTRSEVRSAGSSATWATLAAAVSMRRSASDSPRAADERAGAGETCIRATIGARARGAAPRGRALDESRSAPRVERRPQAREVGGAEDHAIAGGDVDEVEVDPGLGDLPRQVGKHAGPVLDVDHDDLTLPADGEMGDRQRVPRRLGVGDEG